MDGSKEKLGNSIQVRLSAWLAVVIVFAAVAAGAFSFANALNEAEELQDDLLLQIASLAARQDGNLPLSSTPYGDENVDKEERVIIQYLDQAGPLSGSLPIPATLSEGMSTITLAGKAYRVVVKKMPDGKRLAVAQETDVRDEIARDGALRTTMPLLLLVPILAVIVAYIVRSMFKPIAEIADELDNRNEQDLHPLVSVSVPIEVRPFVSAINRLLVRVEKGVEEQRKFVANAAHELRSPLTALSLQAERVANTSISDDTRQRLAELRQGIERGRKLVNQLLTLARVQSATPSEKTWISVKTLYREVLGDLMPLAEQKKIDVGVVTGNDVHVLSSHGDLMTLVRNLIDNAIRYTPAGGRVDLSVSEVNGAGLLKITDTGPGIPNEERDRVFDPFYRILGNDEIGSGLGLSIVKTLSQYLGLSVEMAYADEERQTGLSVVLTVYPSRASHERKVTSDG